MKHDTNWYNADGTHARSELDATTTELKGTIIGTANEGATFIGTEIIKRIDENTMETTLDGKRRVYWQNASRKDRRALWNGTPYPQSLGPSMEGEIAMSSGISRRNFLGVAAAGDSLASFGTVLVPQQTAAAASRNGENWIVDSHVHLKHGDAARTEYLPEVIVETMNKAGIDKSIVFAMSTTTRRSVEMAEAAVKQYPDRLIPYVYALPNYERPVIQEIEAALAGRLFRGIKIHIGECTLADYVIDPVLKTAGRYGAPA